MSDLHLNLFGKPLFFLPSQLQSMSISTPPPLPQIPQLPLPNPWEQVLNTPLLPFPSPAPLGILTAQQHLDLLLNLVNSQLPITSPLNPLFPLRLPTPLMPLPPPPPKTAPVPLMSLRIATPPPFRDHPYRVQSVGMEANENKYKRSRRVSDKKRSRFDNSGNPTFDSRTTQVINQVSSTAKPYFQVPK